MRVDQRRIAHYATVVALTVLPVFVTFQLYIGHKRSEQVYQRLIATLAASGVVEALRDIQAPGEGSQFVIGGIRITPSDNFPSGMEKGSPFTSKNQVVYVLSRKVSSTERLDIEKRIEQSGTPEVLSSFYSRLTTGKNNSDILFVHAVIDSGTDRVLLVFPAVHLGEDYKFQKRPWYEHEVIMGDISVSPLYHDYVYKKPTITLSRKIGMGSRAVRLGFDIMVPVSGSNFGIYFLNLLFAATGALVYWRYYLSSGSGLTRYLLLSTSLLSLGYLMLATNSLLSSMGKPSLSPFLLAEYVSLLPTGSLMILAGRSVRARSPRSERKKFFLYWFCEAGCVLIDLVAKSSFLTSLFACSALWFFGYSILRNRATHEDDRLEDMSPNPRSLSWYVFSAYLFWGAAQFGRLLLSYDFPIVWHLVSRVEVLGTYRELLLDEASSFVVLLYAKGISVFATILFLGAIESARYKKAAIRENAPQLEVDNEGWILRARHLPLDLPALQGANILNLILDDEDRREVRFAMREGRSLRGYLCQLGGSFRDRIVKISLSPASVDGNNFTISFGQVDRSRFLRALDLNLSQEVADLLGEATRIIRDLEPFAQASSSGFLVFSELRDLIERRGALISERAKGESRAMAENEDARPPKMDTFEALDLLRIKLRTLALSLEGFKFIESAQDWSSLPKRVRMSLSVFTVIMTCLLSELSEAWRMGDSGGECRFGLEVDTDEPGKGADSFLLFKITTSKGGNLPERLRLAEVERRFGILWALENATASSNLLLLLYLLELFNGRMKFDNKGSEFEMCLCLRYLFVS